MPEPLTPYEQDIEINEDALDVEWVEHSQRMLKYTRAAAERHRDMDLAKVQLDFTRAQIDKEIREGATSSTRLTEGAINSAILLHEDYAAAMQAYIDAKYQNEVAAGVVKSFEHRKDALGNLVKLHGQSYFAGPSVPHNLTEERRRLANQKIRIRRT